MRKPISTAYSGSIFFDYMLQERRADAIIILPNFPSHNSYDKPIKFWFDRGYNVFMPRYRGTYQSSGKFLSKNPVDDMLEFVKNLDKGHVKNLWDGQRKEFNINKKILIAGGFSAPIACGMAAKSDLFSHLILASPIWDFEKHNSENNEVDLNRILDFVRDSYKNCYRFAFKKFDKVLKKYKELNPDFYLPKLHELKFPVLVFHDPNDKNVLFAKTKSAIEKMPNATLVEHYLGHGLSGDLFQVFWKEFDKFIKINYLRDQEIEKEKGQERDKKKEEKEVIDLKKAILKAEGADKKDMVELRVVGKEK